MKQIIFLLGAIAALAGGCPMLPASSIPKESIAMKKLFLSLTLSALLGLLLLAAQRVLQ